jgi:hypothetical protein
MFNCDHVFSVLLNAMRILKGYSQRYFVELATLLEIAPLVGLESGCFFSNFVSNRVQDISKFEAGLQTEVTHFPKG